MSSSIGSWPRCGSCGRRMLPTNRTGRCYACQTRGGARNVRRLGDKARCARCAESLPIARFSVDAYQRVSNRCVNCRKRAPQSGIRR